MNRIHALICALVLLCAVLPPGRLRPVAADDWLPIPPEDLAMKDNPASPGADAMILYRESVVNAKTINEGGDFDEEYVRIKILTQAGVKNGDVEIAFFKDQNDVKDVRGRTVHADGNVVKFEGKVLEKDIAKQSGLRFLAKTFTLPDVQPGSIIEYKYRIQGNPHWLHDEQWLVSGELFTREAHFTYVPYDGYSGFVTYFRVYGLPSDATPQCRIDGVCSLVARNIPAVVDEPNMPPLGSLRARVAFYYKSTSEPQNENPLQYWNRIAKKWNADLAHFIDKKPLLQQTLAKITATSDSPDVKLRAIYREVQKLRNLNMEEANTQQEQKDEKSKPNTSVEDVLKTGSASSRDLNRLFIGLARAAGFEADEIYVAPRSDHFFRPELEEVRDLGAQIVWVRASGKEYYLDPGAKYFPFGLLPWYESDTQGIRPNDRGAEVVSVPESPITDAQVLRTADIQITGGGGVSGKLVVDFTGQEAALRRERLRHDDETGRKKELEDEVNSWLPASPFVLKTVSDWDDNEKPIHLEGTLEMPGFAGSAGSRALLPEELFKAEQPRSFESQKRVNNVYFQYPFQETDDLKIELPLGYKVESIPKTMPVAVGAALYTISATQQGSAVEVKRQLSLQGVMFSKDAYPALRSFFNLVRTQDDSQIVLQNELAAAHN